MFSTWYVLVNMFLFYILWILIPSAIYGDVPWRNSRKSDFVTYASKFLVRWRIMTRRDVISQTARGVYVRWSIHENFREKLIEKDRSSRRIQ